MNDVRYHYFKFGKGVLTFFTKIDKSKNELCLGFSACSPKDNFVKETGRTISSGRANKKPILIPFSGHSYKDIENFIRNNSSLFPCWVRKHIKTFFWS